MRDFRYAIRSLWRHKSFAAAAIVTLAVGLGANSALFGVVNAALRPLAVPAADQLVTIAAETKNDESGGFQYAFSIDALKDFQERATSFSDVFGAYPRVGGLSADGKPLQFFFSAVSDNYFRALRITPQAGRYFTASTGSPVAVVLGYSFWTQHFGGDPGVVGRPVRVDGHPAVIAGVVPKSFQGTFLGLEVDGYIAVGDLGAIDPGVNAWLYHNRKARAMEVFGRLKPGVTISAAGVEMNTLLDALALEHPDTDAGVGARVVPEPLSRPLPMRVVAEVIPLIQFFGLALAALVLLLACLNVANLMLVRATAREREMAVRAALGATRAQLVRQMVAEGLVISGLGGLAGLVVGQWVMGAFIARLDIGADLPFAFDIGFHWRVFLYSFLAAAASGTAIGLWPAWRASRADGRASLHDGGKGQSDGVDRQRVRRLLVIGQVAGSLALLIVAGLFVRSLVVAQRIDLGFDSAHLVTVRIDPRQVAYDEDRTNEFYKDLIRRVSAWPEVASVSLAFNVPMSYLIGGGAFYVEGRPLPANGQPPVTFLNHVGYAYFDTMRIPIVRGRAFVEDDEHDRSTTRRIAIVNETMAMKMWPGQDPIGKRLRVYGPNEPVLEVVGVARDSKYVLVFEAPRPFLYLPIERDSSMRTLHVRAKGDPALLMPRLEREIASMAPDLPMADLRTMPQSLTGIFGYLIFRLSAFQAGGMGLIGLTLAIVGIYGVVSFGASLRTREFGIRMALGAEPRDVLRLVLGQGLVLVVIGLATGLAAAAAMSRVLAGFVPLINATDWVTFGAITCGLGALALGACYLPARRATKVPPIDALRHE
jgi:predicted permease